MANWHPRAIDQIKYTWAASTRKLYNKMILDFKQFCQSKNYEFPPRRSGPVAHFLCDITDRVVKPSSYIKSATAALSAMYEGMGYENPTHTPDISNLKSALVKAGTKAPREPSKVMPREPFRNMFVSMPENQDLSVKDLRLKAVTLLALSVMLRPSDIAPKAVQYDPATETEHEVPFSTNSVDFHDDGSATLTFFGIKNDRTRTGFKVKLPPHEEPKLDPVKTLSEYISKTRHNRPLQSLPVFISLRQPYKALTSAGIADILNDSIAKAGLSGQGYSAKSFRPTGATAAVEGGG